MGLGLGEEESGKVGIEFKIRKMRKFWRSVLQNVHIVSIIEL